MKRNHITPILQALLAALLFGASAPFSKLLLGDIEPVLLAAFLYLGSGLSLLILKLIQQKARKSVEKEARLQKKDLLWLAGAILAGGVAAPIVQLFGLKSTPASTASLLLNFESVGTTLIAAWIFKEQVGKRTWWAVGLITLASILLSVTEGEKWGFSIGALGILAACFLWGMDNNCTRNISDKNPSTIVMIKGLAAGSFSLILALLIGNTMPNIGVILKALLLGSLSYGASISLFVLALRDLGAARTSVLFGTSPLAGLGFSFLMLHEIPDVKIFIAFPLMVLGTVFLLTENHSHKHFHAAVTHEHAHRHNDGHHNHTHPDDCSPGQLHTHIHQHDELEHEHEHMPDINHRHIHSAE